MRSSSRCPPTSGSSTLGEAAHGRTAFWRQRPRRRVPRQRGHDASGPPGRRCLILCTAHCAAIALNGGSLVLRVCIFILRLVGRVVRLDVCCIYSRNSGVARGVRWGRCVYGILDGIGGIIQYPRETASWKSEMSTAGTTYLSERVTCGTNYVTRAVPESVNV